MTATTSSPFRRPGTIHAELARTIRDNRDADVTDLKRELAASRLHEKIRAIVDAAPPLTDDQRAVLAGLLHKGR